MSQLFVKVSERNIRISILSCLMQLWVDPDSEVRGTGIKAIRELGEKGVPEIRECFNADNPNAPLKLMQELCRLFCDVEYGEKEQLQDLLRWRFSAKQKVSEVAV